MMSYPKIKWHLGSSQGRRTSEEDFLGRKVGFRKGLRWGSCSGSRGSFRCP
ncbi:hypothetical protein LINPERHAP1_LOCUS23097 [Linum perenne]